VTCKPRVDLLGRLRPISMSDLKLTASAAVLPVREVISQGPTVRTRMWTSGWLEEKKNRSSLKAKLWSQKILNQGLLADLRIGMYFSRL
jgi:hypothetical protein